jgi:hypothetical protein
MTLDVVSVAQIDAGALTTNGDTALVVADAPAPPATDAAFAARLGTWIHAGGTFVGERLHDVRGIQTAGFAGGVAFARLNRLPFPTGLAGYEALGRCRALRKEERRDGEECADDECFFHA